MTIYVGEKPEEQKVWIVRASGGDYVPHFKYGSLVAIGHADPLRLPTNRDEQAHIDSQALERAMREKAIAADEDISKASITRAQSIVRAFVEDISVGDMIITVGRSRLMTGVADTFAYIDQNPVILPPDSEGRRPEPLSYSLRRKVRWGPRFTRSQLPSHLQLSLTAHQTVFQLSDAWDEIFSLLYPIFLDPRHTYLSTRLSTRNPVSSYQLSKFIFNLLRIEFLARKAEENPHDPGHLAGLGPDGLEREFKQFLEDGRAELTCSAEFMSPGGVTSRFSRVLSPTGVTYMVLGAGALFGIEVDHINLLHVLEIRGLDMPGALNNEFIQQVYEDLSAWFAETGGAESVDDLHANLPQNLHDELERLEQQE